MATYYNEFDTTAANFATDVGAQILNSTDWARPNAAGKPTLYKATTTRGAPMVVDLADAAVTSARATLAIYTDHDGTTGTAKATRYLPWRQNTSGLAADTVLHCIVSAGKEHLFISVEGPRAGETNADNSTYGSVKNYFFLCDLVPYHAGDTTPAVVCGAQVSNNIGADPTNLSHYAHVSRNAGGTISWGTGRLLTLAWVHTNVAFSQNVTMGCTIDGNTYLFPYVFVDDAQGIRGRLATFFYAGVTSPNQNENSALPLGATVTYSSAPYRILQANKGNGTGSGSGTAWGPLGGGTNYANSNTNSSVIIAVPTD